MQNVIARPKLLIAALTAATLATCAGCRLFGGEAPLQTPEVEWVLAERATLDAIGERFRAYVMEDPELMQDPTARGIWLSALEDWTARVVTHEFAIEGRFER